VRQGAQYISDIGFKRTLGLDTDPGSSLEVGILLGLELPFWLQLLLILVRIFLFRQLLSWIFPPQLFSLSFST
jgi:hypothetical protein